VDLSRIGRLIKARWWVLVLVSALGAIPAVVITSQRNDAIQPVFRASQTITFTQSEEDRTGEGLSSAVEAAQLDAEEANEDILARLGAAGTITGDTQEGTLTFEVFAGDEEAATQDMRDMVRRYRQAEGNAASQAEEEKQEDLAALQVRLEEITDQIADIDAQLAEDPEVVGDREELEEQINALEDRLGDLRVEDILGPTQNPQSDEERTEEDVDAEIAEVEAALDELNAQLDELPAEDEAPQSAEQVERQLLEQQYQAILDQYTTLATADPEDELSFGTAVTEDVTPEPANLLLNGLLGAVAGLLLGLAVLIVADRIRRPVWTTSDLDAVPALGEVPPRTPLSGGRRPWYQTVRRSPRKQAVQALRAAIDGRARQRHLALGFTGMDVSSRDAHALAADYAMSLATAGQRVLLIDGDFAHPSDLPEYDGHGPSLSDVIDPMARDNAAIAGFVEWALSESTETGPGLRAIPVGVGLDDPADAVAGRRTVQLIDAAQERFDAVVVAVGAVSDPTTQTLLYDVDQTVVCIRPGTSTESAVEEMYRDLSSRGVSVLGATLTAPELRGLRGLFRRMTGRGERAPRVPDIIVEPSPAPLPTAVPARPAPPALMPEPEPVGALATAAAVRPTAQGLLEPPQDVVREPVEVDDEVSPLLAEMLDGVDVRRGQLEDELYAQVLAVLTGAGTDTGEPDSQVNRDGFVPLVEIRDHSTIGDLVLQRLGAELDSASQRALDRELASVLGASNGAEGIDEWARRSFFTRHVIETEQHPDVWQIRSREGTFEALVPAVQCTREHLDELRTGMLHAQIDGLNRELRSAVQAGRTDDVDELDAQVKELRTFDITLGWLYEGTTPEARIRYPWRGDRNQPQGWAPEFSEGIRPNLAPMQRLGLLAAPVLSWDELSALAAE
jgi:Mrp family chromosome partitioning ATPase